MTNEPNELPAEVREAIDAAAKKINWRLNTTHYVDIAGIIRDAISPLWPKPSAAHIQVETVTLADGSRMDVIRDIEAVKRALSPQPSAAMKKGVDKP